MIKYITEFIGTFIFFCVIINATSTGSSLASIAPIAIGAALMVVVCFGANISGGHFNPAVSAMMVLNNTLPASEFIPYVAAQLLAAIAAKSFLDLAIKK
jgi:glycerol uptake facilitator-like aquaporin